MVYRAYEAEKIPGMASARTAADAILEQLDADLLAATESLYEDIHRHPELSMQEHRTAGLAAERLRSSGFAVTEKVGGTGVVGLLHNGEGPTVMLRADMDALPIAEQTGLPYSSTVTATDANGDETPVMHACGHDMHVAWLAAAATLLGRTTEHWQGTLIALFQPGEETAQGAKAMIDDGLFDRFPKPDVVLGQHVMPSPAGLIGSRPGVITSAADSLQIRLFGRGAHGSMPQASIDPVVMAASIVLRLQTIVAREVAPTDAVVLTVGALQAGTKENVIPDEAIIKLNVRTFDEHTRQQVLGAIARIANAEAEASGATRLPDITPLDSYDLVENDATATRRVRDALTSRFSSDRVVESAPLSASEDFGSYGTGWKSPSVFWTIGGTDPEIYRKAEQAGKLNELPTNHNPRFAPTLHPTLETGIEALVAAACAWLEPTTS